MRNIVNIFSLLVAFAIIVLAILMYAGVVAVANRGRIVILLILAAVIIVMTMASMRRGR